MARLGRGQTRNVWLVRSWVGNAEIADDDTGTGTDVAADVTVGLAGADTGTGTDVATDVTVAVVGTDTGTGTDAAGTVAAAVTGTDTGAGTDVAAGIAVAISGVDVGTGTDVAAGVVEAVAGSDTGAGTDAAAGITVAVTGADSGAGTDAAASIAAAVSGSDSGTGTDVAAAPVVDEIVAPPGLRRWTSEELLDLRAPQRVESVAFQILNADLTYAFTATQVDTEDAPSIHFDANSDVNRTLSGLRFGPDDAARINPLVHLVRPLWVLDDGSTWPMGVFHFADMPLDVATWGVEFTPECYDRSVLLTQKRAGSFTVPAGMLYTQALRLIIAEAGLSRWAAIDNSTAFPTAPITFSPNTSRQEILATLCQALGWYPPYFDNDGYLRLRAVPNPIHDAPPDVAYTLDEFSRVERGTVRISSNIIDAPNVYRVIGDPAAAAEVIGEYYVPASAPHSVAHRGREVERTIDNQAVQDKATADAAAQAAYVNDFSTYIQVDMQTAPDPRADGMQIARFDGTNYRVQQWGLELTPGGTMVHVLQEVWVP